MRTDRTILNNKLDIIISDNKQEICMLIDVAIPGSRNVTKKEAEKILNYEGLINISTHVECKNKSDTSYNRGDWNHFKITQTIPEQQTRKARS